jgi:hypothetical protein
MPNTIERFANVAKDYSNFLSNISLSLSSFPSEWKLTNVTPVFKNDSPGILKNYLPISLISIIGKVMERCVYKHIYNFLLENRIISSNQSGQKTTLTSFPSSSALPNSFVIYKS